MGPSEPCSWPHATKTTTSASFRPPNRRADYERDFYSWLMEQARFVREGRWSAIDRNNLAEEIESLGREQFNKLESALRVLLLHMLKWDHQPERRSRSWELSIATQRVEVEDVLADNPGLEPSRKPSRALIARRDLMPPGKLEWTQRNFHRPVPMLLTKR